MAGSDVVQAMRLALKPFNIQHLADDWAAQAAGKMLITNMSTLQYDGLREPYIFPEAEAPRGTRGVEERLACPAQPGWQ